MLILKISLQADGRRKIIKFRNYKIKNLIQKIKGQGLIHLIKFQMNLFFKSLKKRVVKIF